MKSKILTILLSLAIAFGMWVYVVTFERTQMEFTFYNVEVKMIGESSLQDRGLVISSISDRNVDLTLSGTRSDIGKLKTSDITVLVDLSTIHEAGEKRLSYEVAFPGSVQNSAIEIVKRTPESIELTVAQWETKDVPVQVEITGTPASTYVIDKNNISTSLKLVNVSGPKELLDKISVAKVYADMEGKNETYEQQLELILCDSNGKRLEGDLTAVTVETRMVVTKIPVLKEKEITLSMPIVSGGGLTKDDVKLSMSMTKFTVNGSPSVVSKMDSILTMEPIKLAEVREGFVNKEYRIELPNGVKYNGSDTVVVFVSLTLPEVQEIPVIISNEQFEIIGVPTGYDAVPAGNLDIVLRGKPAAFANFNPADIRAIVDVAGSGTTGRFSVQIVVPNNLGIGALEDPENPYYVYVLLTGQES